MPAANVFDSLLASTDAGLEDRLLAEIKKAYSMMTKAYAKKAPPHWEWYRRMYTEVIEACTNNSAEKRVDVVNTLTCLWLQCVLLNTNYYRHIVATTESTPKTASLVVLINSVFCHFVAPVGGCVAHDTVDNPLFLVGTDPENVLPPMAMGNIKVLAAALRNYYTQA